MGGLSGRSMLNREEALENLNITVAGDIPVTEEFETASYVAAEFIWDELEKDYQEAEIEKIVVSGQRGDEHMIKVFVGNVVDVPEDNNYEHQCGNAYVDCIGTEGIMFAVELSEWVGEKFIMRRTSDDTPLDKVINEIEALYGDVVEFEEVEE